MNGGDTRMSFDQNEQLIETEIVSRTVMIMGAGETWHLTDSDTDLVDFQGNIYEAVDLDVDDITADAAMGGNETTVKIPKTVSIYDKFVPDQTRSTFRIVIRQATHVGGQIQDAPILFTGTILDPATSGVMGETLVLKCTTQMYKLYRNGMRRHYQHQCSHLLYGPDCRASEITSSFEARIGRDTQGVWFEINGDDPANPMHFRGVNTNDPEQRVWMSGLSIEFAGRRYETLGTTKRYLGYITYYVRIFPDDLDELTAAINATPTANRVCRIIPNCDHTLRTCTKIHDNALNFGGMPWIPFKNPVGTHFIG